LQAEESVIVIVGVQMRGYADLAEVVAACSSQAGFFRPDEDREKQAREEARKEGRPPAVAGWSLLILVFKVKSMGNSTASSHKRCQCEIA
jgi:hypothetical protein